MFIKGGIENTFQKHITVQFVWSDTLVKDDNISSC